MALLLTGISLGFLGGIMATIVGIWMYENSMIVWEDEDAD
jgi:hypothetical protein